MVETVEVIRSVKNHDLRKTIELIQKRKGVFITGEGSSRIVPAKNLIYRNLINGSPLKIITEEATQSMEYDLRDFVVIAISNSGKTREVIRLLKMLQKEKHGAVLGITANESSLLRHYSDSTLVLNCGKEKAVAASKSVVEQALLLDRIYHLLTQNNEIHFESLAKVFLTVLKQSIDSLIVKKLVDADMLYFAGRNTGVVEELTLKTNEIARKKADFLEGTYCLHGIEEVMTSKEAVVLIDPFPEEEDNIYDVLVKGVGIPVIAIAPRPTRFQTIINIVFLFRKRIN
jgi:glucosamine--fructose-6-phosphate aminotransferase (isomerizing)